MNRLDIEKAIKSRKSHDWFNTNVAELIAGKNAGFIRENEITKDLIVHLLRLFIDNEHSIILNKNSNINQTLLNK